MLLMDYQIHGIAEIFLSYTVNADECIMTRIQEMSLDYHFSVEQEVGSSTYSFFGFNGTYKMLIKLHFE